MSMTELRTEVPAPDGTKDAEVIASKRVEEHKKERKGILGHSRTEDDGFFLYEMNGWKR